MTSGRLPTRAHSGAPAELCPPGSPLRALTIITALILLTLSLPACGWDPYRVTPGCTSADDPSPATAAQALSPRTLVISPLTSIRRSETAEDQLILHLALHDGFGQPVKALGVVAVELVRPLAHAEDGTPIHSPDSTAHWELDLRDPEVNAETFDGLVTRTYALRLGGLPGGDAPSAAALGGWATLRATFTVVDGGWGESRILTAEARVAW